MDIISEILEADAQAEDQLVKARAERERLISECEGQIAKIKADAAAEAERYRNEALGNAEADVKGSADGEGEEAVKGFEALYLEKHAQWEDEIFKAVTEG